MTAIATSVDILVRLLVPGARVLSFGGPNSRIVGSWDGFIFMLLCCRLEGYGFHVFPVFSVGNLWTTFGDLLTFHV